VTLADRIYALLLERGPLSACSIRVELRCRKLDVLIALREPRFHQEGRGRSSRWDVVQAGSFTLDDVAGRWGSFTEGFLADFEELGLVERVNGNGRLRVTNEGLEVSAVLHGAAEAWGWRA
jgi:hypothetical protein